jgi:hypothetical protein
MPNKQGRRDSWPIILTLTWDAGRNRGSDTANFVTALAFSSQTLLSKNANIRHSMGQGIFPPRCGTDATQRAHGPAAAWRDLKAFRS